jgi:hypothetical protein
MELQFRLRELIAVSFPPGHYKLQLGDRHDRLLVQRLVEIGSEQKIYRKTNGMIDTSQKGDWENWRNERLDGAEYDLDEKVASQGGVPYGLLEFDFVSTEFTHRLVRETAMPGEPHLVVAIIETDPATSSDDCMNDSLQTPFSNCSSMSCR